MVWLFTDGACSGNPGPGAWAWICQDGNERVQESGYEDYTTNNRMELSAALYGLSSLHTRDDVTVVSDSSYLVKGMEEWVYKWQKNTWMNAQKRPVENQDLWKSLLQETQRFSKIYWSWVKGHGTHQGNIDADTLARTTLRDGKSYKKTSQTLVSSCREQDPVSSGLWFGDKTGTKGLLTSFPEENSIHILHFRDRDPVRFTGDRWQIFCLNQLKVTINSVSAWNHLGISVTVQPNIEEAECYQAHNFRPKGNLLWSLLLTAVFGVLFTLNLRASNQSFGVKQKESIGIKPKEYFHAYLKAKRVYWRAGPGSEHSVLWSYTCPGWPVFIRKRWSYWCQIEDIKGARGWVHGNLLAFRRVVFVLYQQTPLRSHPSASGAIKAYLQKGVLGLCLKEEENWIYVRLLRERYEGWVYVQHVWNPRKGSE
ncbi:ribonuclease H [Holospora obtusa F1]|uniref:ribonuclease H n=1 Tax=Holospora obtusa F1 TaxID=1399147 RepID=W6TFK6_HOLOB|nr:ribonuclease HI [Holospora obtusa]ETZ06795.1 ribonuclease H [Holospora obtusa F1]